MGFLFFLFVMAFLYAITCMNYAVKTKGKISRNRNTDESLTTLTNIFRRLIKCLSFRKKSKYPYTNDNSETSNISPVSSDVQLPVKSNNRRRRAFNYLDNKCLDKMKYVGEKLESFIEYKFTRLGLFCATYPKLVLIIGFSFCFLMCLGYTNFQVGLTFFTYHISQKFRNTQYFLTQKGFKKIPILGII